MQTKKLAKIAENCRFVHSLNAFSLEIYILLLVSWREWEYLSIILYVIHMTGNPTEGTAQYVHLTSVYLLV